MGKVSNAFIDFACEYSNYNKLPERVIQGAKKVLLDGIGDALGGISSDKGKIGVSMARAMGGVPQSTLIGIGGKYSAPVAAFANAEMLNGLDLDPVPHIPPIVVPALLAVAEAQGASGKELLAALSVGQEVARRLSRVLLSIMTVSVMKCGKTPDIFGNSNEHIIGAAVGNGILMGLDREQMAHAIAISAYFCSLPVCRDWESTMPKSMIKYVPVSWMAQGSVQAAQLAKFGYTGNKETLDTDLGFPAIYCREEGVWDPDKVIERLGEEWFSTAYSFKPYPCCRYLHSVLDCFYKLLGKYRFAPHEIESVDCYTSAFVAHPDQYAVENQIDAQFSGPYCIALAAMNYKPGPAWQDTQALTDPAIHDFMHRVKMHVAPEYAEHKKKDQRSWYGRVEVHARSQVFTEETLYSKGTNMEGWELSDEEFYDRLRTCASVILPKYKIERAIEIIEHIEDYPSLDKLMENITL